MMSFIAKLWASQFTVPPAPNASRRIVMGCVDQLYTQFKHVMVINDDAAWYIWADDKELDAWCFENRCYYMYDRALYDRWMKRWCSNGIGGGDYYFIATDDDEHFIYAQMVWG
jgi:hypothetical protein